MATASINGVMDAPIKETGKITICTARVSSFGPMEESTKASTSKTKWKAMAYTHGPTENNTKANGCAASTTEKEYIEKQEQQTATVTGKTARESNGLMMKPMSARVRSAARFKARDPSLARRKLKEFDQLAGI